MTDVEQFWLRSRLCGASVRPCLGTHKLTQNILSGFSRNLIWGEFK